MQPCLPKTFPKRFYARGLNHQERLNSKMAGVRATRNAKPQCYPSRPVLTSFGATVLGVRYL